MLSILQLWAAQIWPAAIHSIRNLILKLQVLADPDIIKLL